MTKTTANTDCTECMLAKQCVPSGLPLKDLFHLNSAVNTNNIFEAESVIFRQNTTATHLYIVKTGVFKTQRIINDTEHVDNFFLPGEFIGLDSIAGGVYANTAVAIERSLVCKIEYRQLAALRKRFPGLSDLSVKTYSNALAAASEQQNTITLQCASARLASFLVSYNKRASLHQQVNTGFNLPMTRQDIASHLGLAAETISRSFSKLSNSGAISKEGRRVNILDAAILQEHVMEPPR
ncbi:MAG: Crp/Fnr family transcriptional regulator [Cycloclasticus sp.]|nr:Crp/Fnr family transcriptional regulator [Cycloclasticus sp.]